MNANNLSTLTRKNSQNPKTNSSYKESHAHQKPQEHSTELERSLHNSLENLNTDTIKCPTVNVSPAHLIQTDSSDSPNPLITSTASLSSSSSSSNTAVITSDHLTTHCSVKKRVWTPVTQSNSLSYSKQNEVNNCPAPSNLPEVILAEFFFFENRRN